MIVESSIGRGFLVLDQIIEQTIPHTGLGPAHEPLVYALVPAVALWQIRPAHAGADHPQHPVDKAPVIFRRPTDRPRPTWQQRLDPPPLNPVDSYRKLPICPLHQVPCSPGS